MPGFGRFLCGLRARGSQTSHLAPAQGVYSGTRRKWVPDAHEQTRLKPPDVWKEVGHGNCQTFQALPWVTGVGGRKEAILGGADEPSCPDRKGGPHCSI